MALGSIILAALAALTLALAGHNAIAAWRVWRATHPRPSLRDGLALPLPDPPPSVCIVVPAHNEEQVIGRCARSIAQLDYPDVRAVFALDRCTDGTEAALREAMADASIAWDVVRVDSCPDPWQGKPHAVWQGLTRSPLAQDAALLLFVDADTWFEPAALRAAAALLCDRSLGLLSLLSTLEERTWWERLVQPWAGFALLRRYAIDRVNAGKTAFANGQFMLFARDAYERVGGHEAVKHHVLEDIALATRARKRSVKAELRFADGLFRCAMYRSWNAFVAGWKRIFVEGHRLKARRLRRAGTRLLLTATVAPLLSLALLLAPLAVGGGEEGAALVGLVGAAGLAAWALFAALTLRTQRLPLTRLLVAPVGAAVAAALLLRTASDLQQQREVRWGGRTFTRKARD